MDEYRLRFFAAHAYATQMGLFNSISSPSLSQALSVATMPSSYSPPTNLSNNSNAVNAGSGLSRSWLSSSTDSSESLNTTTGPPRSQSPSDQRPSSTSAHQRVMTCPLCGLSLEGCDVSSHFYEEVRKMETLRSALRMERLNHWGNREATTGHSPVGMPWPPNSDVMVGDHHHHQHRVTRPHPFFDCPDSPCKRLRLHGDKTQPCSRWQTYQRVRQNRQSRLEAKKQQTRDSFIGLLRCKQRSSRIDDKQEKSSTTSSPQASPGSIVCSNGNSGNNNNNMNEGKANGHNGKIWSIVGDIEVRQDNAISSSRNWSPIRMQDEKEILREKTRDLDLIQTIIPEDHMHCKKLAIEPDSGSLDEQSDAASSGNETSVDVEVEVI